MSVNAEELGEINFEVRGLREENRTLYGVIKLVSSSLEVMPMLQGVIDLATEATGCHACFIYLLEDGALTIRAASPVFADAVGNVQLALGEGLTGWVARHRAPAFIRDRAMDDPRMKYVSQLQEERFQSMVAVPILSRSNRTIGVIVLHTEAPHEFTEDTLKLLVHIASLVSGAIENAQLYDQQRRRVDALTGLSGLAQEVAAASDADQLAPAVTRGIRRLLGAQVCQLYRLEADGAGLQMLASSPESAAALQTHSAASLLLDALDDQGTRPTVRTVWPELDVGELVVTPLSAGGERVGLLCAGSRQGRAFSEEDTEIVRAVAHLTAVAIKRAELIEGLTNANIVKDLFEALAAGATAFAATKAAEVRCDLSAPYVIVCAEPVGGFEQGSGEWRAAAELLGSELGGLSKRAAIEAGPGPVRALLTVGGGPGGTESLLSACRELGRNCGAAIGLSETCQGPADAGRAYREALDAATIGRALLAEGGAIAYSQLGAYRYLVQIEPQDAPRDRMRAAVDLLIAYDNKRRTALLDTLERYLAERRSVIESARVLFIHPNTLRQRLGRIEELTGLDLDKDDLLSLELAIKLARLHGRPGSAGPGGGGI